MAEVAIHQAIKLVIKLTTYGSSGYMEYITMPYVEILTDRVSVAGNEYTESVVKWIDYHEIIGTPVPVAPEVPEARFHSLRTCLDPNCEICLEEWFQVGDRSEFDYKQMSEASEPRILPADWDEIPF